MHHWKIRGFRALENLVYIRSGARMSLQEPIHSQFVLISVHLFPEEEGVLARQGLERADFPAVLTDGFQPHLEAPQIRQAGEHPAAVFREGAAAVLPVGKRERAGRRRDRKTRVRGGFSQHTTQK